LVPSSISFVGTCELKRRPPTPEVLSRLRVVTVPTCTRVENKDCMHHLTELHCMRTANMSGGRRTFLRSQPVARCPHARESLPVSLQVEAPPALYCAACKVARRSSTVGLALGSTSRHLAMTAYVVSNTGEVTSTAHGTVLPSSRVSCTQAAQGNKAPKQKHTTHGTRRQFCARKGTRGDHISQTVP
jgi:hypothetical protein